MGNNLPREVTLEQLTVALEEWEDIFGTPSHITSEVQPRWLQIYLTAINTHHLAWLMARNWPEIVALVTGSAFKFPLPRDIIEAAKQIEPRQTYI